MWRAAISPALAAEVRHDPRQALDGGADGLDGYRALASQAPMLLAPNGHLVAELGLGQEAAVAGLFKRCPLVPSAGACRPRRHPAGVARAYATMTP